MWWQNAYQLAQTDQPDNLANIHSRPIVVHEPPTPILYANTTLPAQKP